MVEERSFDEYFYETMSDVGKEIFSDFLSEITRRRQNYVLIASIVAILVSFAFVAPVEGELVGIKFSLSSAVLSSALFGIICVYFLIIYIVSVLQDLQYHEYRIMPAVQKQKIIARKLTEENKKKVKLNVEIEHPAGQKPDVIENIFAQAKKIQEKYDQQIENLTIESAELLDDGRAGDAFELQHQANLLWEKSRQEQLEVYASFNNPGQDAIQDIDNEENLNDDELTQKAAILFKAQAKYKRYNTLRLLVEIIFPVGLALYAIWICLGPTIVNVVTKILFLIQKNLASMVINP